MIRVPYPTAKNRDGNPRPRGFVAQVIGDTESTEYEAVCVCVCVCVCGRAPLKSTINQPIPRRPYLTSLKPPISHKPSFSFRFLSNYNYNTIKLQPVMKPTTLCALLVAAGTPISSAFRIVTYRGSDCHGAVMNSFSVSSTSLAGGCSEAINTEASSATIQPESGDRSDDGMYPTYRYLPYLR